ncbi:MAG: TIGR00730 family Rossman fold protein [Burkholderiales bacterium]|nr:TIGR00730 family Rossman fold protein [Burkholderiales bacterium]
MTDRGRFTVCVYCGSRPGGSPAFADAARRLGDEIGRRGWALVYGGGRAGLMGIVADAALAAGATVTGVIPERLMQRELGHPGLHELRVVTTMHERKQRMAERAHAFVALPGGIGTFEEFFEVWTWRHLGYHDQPIGLLNVNGFYDGLLAFLARTQADGFVDGRQQAMLQVHQDVGPLLDQLADLAGRATGPDDYTAI